MLVPAARQTKVFVELQVCPRGGLCQAAAKFKRAWPCPPQLSRAPAQLYGQETGGIHPSFPGPQPSSMGRKRDRRQAHSRRRMSSSPSGPQRVEWGGGTAQGCAQGPLPTLPVSFTAQGSPRNAPGSAETNSGLGAGGWGAGEGAPLATAESKDSTVPPNTQASHPWAAHPDCYRRAGKGGTQS